jgi:hypothetical protein
LRNVNTDEHDRPAETNKIGEYPPHDYDESSQTWTRAGQDGSS